MDYEARRDLDRHPSQLDRYPYVFNYPIWDYTWRVAVSRRNGRAPERLVVSAVECCTTNVQSWRTSPGRNDR